MPSFSYLPPQDQMAVLQQIFPRDKPTLRSMAGTNRQINVLATPLLMAALIDHAERKIETCTTSADKVAAILLIHQKLVDNADSLPVMGSAELWERLTALALKEVNCMASIGALGKGIEASIRFDPTTGRSVQGLIAMQRSLMLFNEISKALTKGFENIQADLARAIKDC
jgi:hypothetical protein